MNMIKQEVLLLIIVSLSPLVFSLPCERPPTQELCDSFASLCAPVDVKKCTAAGGQHLRNASFCNHCDICGKIVGAGEACRNSIAAPGGQYLIGVCLPLHICSRNSEGVCVKPEDCEYETTTKPTTQK